MMRARLLALAGAVCLLAASTASAGTGVRSPNPDERAAIEQALFDYYFTNTGLAHVQAVKVKVEPLSSPSPLRSRLVTKYASIGVHAFDATGQDVGYALAVAVYYASPMRGWRVFNDGTSNVGCGAQWYPAGRQIEILASLGIKCR